MERGTSSPRARARLGWDRSVRAGVDHRACLLKSACVSFDTLSYCGRTIKRIYVHHPYHRNQGTTLCIRYYMYSMPLPHEARKRQVGVPVPTRAVTAFAKTRGSVQLQYIHKKYLRREFSPTTAVLRYSSSMYVLPLVVFAESKHCRLSPTGHCGTGAGCTAAPFTCATSSTCEVLRSIEYE